MKKLIIETDKLIQNIENIKKMTTSTIIAVLKGNGYGLGIVEYARLLERNGIYYFAVSELEEALTLRKNGFTGKLLLLSPTVSSTLAEQIIKNEIIPTIGSEASALAINEAAKQLGCTVDVHLKLDTGFGRFGFLPKELETLPDLLNSLDNINIAGTYTHLSFSFAKKQNLVQEQFDKFKNSVQKLNDCGINMGMLHICNSCAFLQYPEMHLDAVRVGSAFLGRIPLENKYSLSKIGFLKSSIIEIKDLPPKQFIGYANTYRTKADTRIGIVPVGYKDGFGMEKIKDTFRFMDILRYMYNDFKQLNKSIYVRVNGKRVRILGRINMFNIIVDLSGIDAKIDDEVILEINPLFVNSLIEREFTENSMEKALVE